MIYVIVALLALSVLALYGVYRTEDEADSVEPDDLDDEPKTVRVLTEIDIPLDKPTW